MYRGAGSLISRNVDFETGVQRLIESQSTDQWLDELVCEARKTGVSSNSGPL